MGYLPNTAIQTAGHFAAAAERWYDKFVPVADRLYDEHLELLEKEGDS